MLKGLTTEEIKAQRTNKRTILLFTADWCGDCVFLKPFLPEIEAAYQNYTFVEVDRDAHIDFAQELGIMGIPSFIAYHNGEVVGDFISKDRKTKEEIEAFLDTVESKIKSSEDTKE